MAKDSTNFRFGYLLLLLLSAPFIRFNSCMASQADSAEALQLATEMHQQMARDDFDGIYENADSGFKDNVAEESNRAYLGAIERNLGSPMACEQGETKVKLFPSRKIWTQCTTRFSKSSTALETFVWVKSGDKYRLYHYDLKTDNKADQKPST